MSNVDLLQVNPVELKFIFELKKTSSCSMQISNKSDKHVAFKVKTTNPKKFCVRPNTGVLLPRSTCDVLVTMQAQRDAPTGLQSKDKFLIQSVVVRPGTSGNNITMELFNKGSGKHVEEYKLRVSYVLPPMSNDDLLLFDPVELQFPFELNKQISCSLTLSNKSNNHVAFKVLPTNSRIFSVRPNCGVIEPRSTCDVAVTMQAEKDGLSDLQCKDKLKIQSVVVFNQESVNHVEERDLRVSYVLPARPPSLVQQVSYVPPPMSKGPWNHVEEYKSRVSYVSPPMSNGDLLQYDPSELQFPFESNKQISCSLELSNKSNNHVAYKLLTTNPKKYCVRPNTGVLLPRSTSDVKVTMQAQEYVPTDLHSNDKFLIQCVVVSPGISVDDITRELFTKGSENHVEGYKLRVSYVLPPRPPSLVREVPNERLAYTAAVSDNWTANAADFKLANPEVLDWRGKLTTLLRKFRVLFATNESNADNFMIATFGDKSNEERLIREQKMDGVLAPLLSNC